MKSFRWQVIFWTSGIAGIVMLGFSLMTLLAYEKLRQSQIDSTLEFLAGRPLPQPLHFGRLERIRLDVGEQAARRLGLDGVFGAYRERDLERDEQAGTSAAASLRTKAREVFGDSANWPEVLPMEERREERVSRFIQRERPGPIRAPRSLELIDHQNLVTGIEWRVAIARHPGFNIMVAVRKGGESGEVASLRNALALIFPVSLIVVGVSIWFYVTRAIRPISELESAMGQVSAGSLDRRAEIESVYSEFDALVLRFDEMLERLHRSFAQATRFSADAAHELKTPLTILQGQIEAALQDQEAGAPAQATLAGLLEEVFRLKAITRKLLLLAQADAGKLAPRSEATDLLELARETAGLFFDEVEASLWHLPQGGVVFAYCDRSLTRQILTNLFSNAAKYRWPLNEAISVRIGRESEHAWIEVENACSPIGLEQREALFDRFSRLDGARSRTSEGTGLGLALALEFARAQGGDLRSLDSGRADWICIRLELPA